MMTTSAKPFLPPLQSLLYGERQSAEPCTVLLDCMRPRFYSDDQGIIRLPPLNNGLIPRPKSVDSAIRHTVVTRPVEAEVKAEPSTPLPKTTSAACVDKKQDVLTPLSAARAIITPSTNDKKRAFAFITHSQETFPKKEPKIDNAPLARRKRRRTSTQELNILQAEFEQCPAPSKHKRQELAERCNMSVKAIQIWFQNRRQASKRHKNSINKMSTTAVDVKEASNESVKEDINSTPLASKTIKTPEAPKAASLLPVVLPEASPTKQDHGKVGPAVTTPPAKRGQALTFHLTSDKKVLTPIKTSPNTRVNRLINGTPGVISPFRSKKNHMSPHMSPKSRLEHKKIPLRELNTNTLVH